MTVLGICAICQEPIVEKRTSPSAQFPRGESYLGHRATAYTNGRKPHEPVIATKSTPLFTTADTSATETKTYPSYFIVEAQTKSPPA